MKRTIITACLLLAACVMANAQSYTTLGVGINNPQGTLHVHNSTITFGGEEPPLSPDVEGDTNELRDPPDIRHSESTIHLTNGITGTTLSDGFVIDCYDNVTTLCQKESADLILKNHNTELILTSGGKVGVGSVYGTYKFNVNGTARVSGTLVTGGSINCSGNGLFSGYLKVGSGFNCTSDGALKVKSLRVTTTDWPDYVFGDGHRLMPLREVEGYIHSHGHLPEVPSAEEAEADGVDLGEMNRLLLQKVEELTLYVIDLQKQLDELKLNK